MPDRNENIATPPSARPGALNTVGRVRAELGNVYRDARQGRISPQDLTRFAYALNALARMIAFEEFERRIDALEAEADRR